MRLWKLGGFEISLQLAFYDDPRDSLYVLQLLAPIWAAMLRDSLSADRIPWFVRIVSNLLDKLILKG